jgi:hypothetical protein
MKLLREFIRLRAAGRRLLSARRDSRNLNYAITVPQPLRCATSDVNRETAPASVGGGKSSSAHSFCHASSR